MIVNFSKMCLIPVAAIFLLYPKYSYGQESRINSDTTAKVVLHFRFDKTVIDSGYMHNAISLKLLEQILSVSSKASVIDSIWITATSSPEGNMTYNQHLAERRAEAVRKYILWKYSGIQASIVSLSIVDGNWKALRDLVEEDEGIPCKQQVLNAIDEKTSPALKRYFLKRIDNGKAWSYMARNYFASLRSGTVQMQLQCRKEEKTELSDSPSTPADKYVSGIQPSTEEPMAVSIMPSGTKRIRPIAFKTNLLFDVATLLNLEVEVPLAPRWSLAGEWMFPWWLWEEKQNSLELLSGNIEARYWFKPCLDKQDESLKRHNPLTGWFIGLYGGGGCYDLEWKKKGYQGEFFIATGISAGYVVPLARNFSMEFSLGIGYMQTKYRHYKAEFGADNAWHLIRQNNGIYKWFGPTKAKVSLIWYPHIKTKKGGIGK